MPWAHLQPCLWLPCAGRPGPADQHGEPPAGACSGPHRPPHGAAALPRIATEMGKLLSSYLEKKNEVKDHWVHLLFSANRPEQVPLIEKWRQGVTLDMDGFASSGFAITSARENCPLHWCKQLDVGLPTPDLLLFLQQRWAEAVEPGWPPGSEDRPSRSGCCDASTSSWRT